MKPIIKGNETSFELCISDIKRPCAFGEVLFECPNCGVIFEIKNLLHGEHLEYGNFYSPDMCWECGQVFEDVEWEVTATVTIKEKSSEEN